MCHIWIDTCNCIADNFIFCIAILDFFIQYWREPICELLKYWSRLEQRTKQVIDILKNAARERCRCKNNNEGGDNDVAYSRKERDKMKKSLIAIEEILSRGKTHKSNPKDDAVSCIYEPISELIDARAKMRQLWDQREKDEDERGSCNKPNGRTN